MRVGESGKVLSIMERWQSQNDEHGLFSTIIYILIIASIGAFFLFGSPILQKLATKVRGVAGSVPQLPSW